MNDVKEILSAGMIVNANQSTTERTTGSVDSRLLFLNKIVPKEVLGE